MMSQGALAFFSSAFTHALIVAVLVAFTCSSFLTQPSASCPSVVTHSHGFDAFLAIPSPSPVRFSLTPVTPMHVAPAAFTVSISRAHSPPCDSESRQNLHPNPRSVSSQSQTAAVPASPIVPLSLFIRELLPSRLFDTCTALCASLFLPSPLVVPLLGSRATSVSLPVCRTTPPHTSAPTLSLLSNVVSFLPPLVAADAAAIDVTAAATGGVYSLTGPQSSLELTNVGATTVRLIDVTIANGAVSVTGAVTSPDFLLERVHISSTTAASGAVAFASTFGGQKLRIVDSSIAFTSATAPPTFTGAVTFRGGVDGAAVFEVTRTNITASTPHAASCLYFPQVIRNIGTFRIEGSRLTSTARTGELGTAVLISGGVKNVASFLVLDSHLEGYAPLQRRCGGIYLDNGIHNVSLLSVQRSTLRGEGHSTALGFYIWAPYSSSHGMKDIAQFEVVDSLITANVSEDGGWAIVFIGGHENVGTFTILRSNLSGTAAKSSAGALSLHASLDHAPQRMQIAALRIAQSTLRSECTTGAGCYGVTMTGRYEISSFIVEDSVLTAAGPLYDVVGIRFVDRPALPTMRFELSHTQVSVSGGESRVAGVLFIAGIDASQGQLLFNDTTFNVSTSGRDDGVEQTAALIFNASNAAQRSTFQSLRVVGGSWRAVGYARVYNINFVRGIQNVQQYIVAGVEFLAEAHGGGTAYPLFCGGLRTVGSVLVENSTVTARSINGTHALVFHYNGGLEHSDSVTFRNAVFIAEAKVVAACFYADHGLRHTRALLFDNTTFTATADTDHARVLFVGNPAIVNVTTVTVRRSRWEARTVSGQRASGFGTSARVTDVTAFVFEESWISCAAATISARGLEFPGLDRIGTLVMQRLTLHSVADRATFGFLSTGGVKNTDSVLIADSNFTAIARPDSALGQQSGAIYIDQGLINITTFDVARTNLTAVANHTAFPFFVWSPGAPTVLNVSLWRVSHSRLWSWARTQPFGFHVSKTINDTRIVIEHSLISQGGLAKTPAVSAALSVNLGAWAISDTSTYFYDTVLEARDGVGSESNGGQSALVKLPKAYVRTNITFDTVVMKVTPRGEAQPSPTALLDLRPVQMVDPYTVVDTASPESWIAFGCRGRYFTARFDSPTGPGVQTAVLPPQLRPLVTADSSRECLWSPNTTTVTRTFDIRTATRTAGGTTTGSKTKRLSVSLSRAPTPTERRDRTETLSRPVPMTGSASPSLSTLRSQSASAVVPHSSAARSRPEISSAASSAARSSRPSLGSLPASASSLVSSSALGMHPGTSSTAPSSNSSKNSSESGTAPQAAAAGDDAAFLSSGGGIALMTAVSFLLVLLFIAAVLAACFLLKVGLFKNKTQDPDGLEQELVGSAVPVKEGKYTWQDEAQRVLGDVMATGAHATRDVGNIEDSSSAAAEDVPIERVTKTSDPPKVSFADPFAFDKAPRTAIDPFSSVAASAQPSSLLATVTVAATAPTPGNDDDDDDDFL